MPIDAASWYEQDPHGESFYQGDVVRDVPVVLMPPAGDAPWTLLRPSPPHTVEQVLAGQTPRTLKPHPESSRPDAWRLGAEIVLAKGIKAPAMVVTQTCDLDSRNWIQLAPVFPASKIEDPRKRASLGVNEIGYMFILPADPPRLAEDSYADLSMITAVHKSYLRRGGLVVRLKSPIRALYQRHLANLHGRPFSFNVHDIVPETGPYGCHNCYLRHGRITRAELVEGQPCTACPSCGEEALWIMFGE